MKFETPLLPDARPHFQSLRSHSCAHLNIIDEEVDRLLVCELVEPTVSCWNANVVLVLRHDRKLRLGVARRRLNFVSVRQKPVNPLKNTRYTKLY